MEVKLRMGTEKDMQAVYDLIYELAVYEKAPEEVIVNPGSLLHDFKEDAFEFIVAEQNNKVLGMALYFEAYSTWKGKMIYLDDLVVRESYRNSGIGQKLIEMLVKIAKDRHVALLKWQVLDWNEPALNFYRKLKADFDGEWINCKIKFK